MELLYNSTSCCQCSIVFKRDQIGRFESYRYLSFLSLGSSGSDDGFVSGNSREASTCGPWAVGPSNELLFHMGCCLFPFFSFQLSQTIPMVEFKSHRTAGNRMPLQWSARTSAPPWRSRRRRRPDLQHPPQSSNVRHPWCQAKEAAG